MEAAPKTPPGDLQSQSRVSACPQVGFKVGQGQGCRWLSGLLHVQNGGSYEHGGGEMTWGAVVGNSCYPQLLHLGIHAL